MKRFHKISSVMLTIIYMVFIVLYSSTAQAADYFCKCCDNATECCSIKKVTERTQEKKSKSENKSCCPSKSSDQNKSDSSNKSHAVDKKGHKCKCSVSQKSDTPHEGKKAHTLPHSNSFKYDFSSVILVLTDILMPQPNLDVACVFDESPPGVISGYSHLFSLRGPPALG